ncbi:hypothetical protein N9Q68_01885 [Polaribacter sp.]|nr:hypothetical protein [Polaribacter sp.]
MKNIGIVLMVLLTTLSCRAQIIAVEDFENYNQDLEDGAYIKDINNVLDKYVGTWKGTYSGKNYEFKVIKVTKDNVNLKYKHDKLLMRYKITDSSNNIIVNTLDLPNGDIYIVRGSYLRNDGGGYVLDYQGLDAECGQNGTIYISVSDATNEIMKLGFLVDGEMGLDCTAGGTAQVLPTTSGLELIKQ